MFHILGYFLIALPFVGLFVLGCKTIGFKWTLFAFGITGVIAGIIAVGVLLIS